MNTTRFHHLFVTQTRMFVFETHNFSENSLVSGVFPSKIYFYIVSLIFLVKMELCSLTCFNTYCFIWHLAFSNKNLGYIHTKRLQAIQPFFFNFYSFSLKLNQQFPFINICFSTVSFFHHLVFVCLPFHFSSMLVLFHFNIPFLATSLCFFKQLEVQLLLFMFFHISIKSQFLSMFFSFH